MNARDDNQIFKELEGLLSDINLNNNEDQRRRDRILEAMTNPDLLPEHARLYEARLEELQSAGSATLELSGVQREWVKLYSDSEVVEASIGRLALLPDELKIISEALTSTTLQKHEVSKDIKSVASGVIKSNDDSNSSVSASHGVPIEDDVYETLQDDSDQHDFDVGEFEYDDSNGILRIGTREGLIEKKLLGASFSRISHQQQQEYAQLKVDALKLLLASRDNLSVRDIIAALNINENVSNKATAITSFLRTLRVNDKRVIQPARRGREAPYIISKHLDPVRETVRAQLAQSSDSLLDNLETDPRNDIYVTFFRPSGTQSGVSAVSLARREYKQNIWKLNSHKNKDVVDGISYEKRVESIIRTLASEDKQEGLTFDQIYTLITGKTNPNKGTMVQFFDGIEQMLSEVTYGVDNVFEIITNDNGKKSIRINALHKLRVSNSVSEKLTEAEIIENARNANDTSARTSAQAAQNEALESEATNLEKTTVPLVDEHEAEDSYEKYEDILSSHDIAVILSNVRIRQYQGLKPSDPLYRIKELMQNDAFVEGLQNLPVEYKEVRVKETLLARVQDKFIDLWTNESNQSLIRRLPNNDLRKLFFEGLYLPSGRRQSTRPFTKNDVINALFMYRRSK